jgi:pyrroloquinoline quinone biosynthesis protein E
MTKINIPFSIPTPKPDELLYHSTLKKSFQLYPKREENYKKFLANPNKPWIEYAPVKMDIELTSRCNFQCSICLHSAANPGYFGSDMSFADFKKLLDNQPGIIELKLQGVGEPLLHPNFFKMIDYARQKEIWVRSSTNGSLLHINNNFRHLIDADISEIQVSIDGTSQETFELIRPGGHFSRVKENCILLNQYSHSVHKKRTRMWTVLQKENCHELSQFPKLASDLGFNRLSISLELADWGNTFGEEISRMHSVNPQTWQKQFIEVYQKGLSLGIEVSFWTINKKYSFHSPANVCPWPFSRSYISSNLHIVPCCKIADPQTADFGLAKDFKNIWFGEKYQWFRDAHLQGKIPKYCQSCYENRR